MNIQTKFHGEQDIIREEVIHFEAGIPGFPNEKEFYLFPLAEGVPFLALQSIQTTEVAFIIIDPFQIFSDYEFDLPDEVLESLQIKVEKDIAIFVILNVQEPFEKTTANLQAPVIINQKSKKAKQYIINRSSYTTKHLIIQPTVNTEQGVK